MHCNESCDFLLYYVNTLSVDYFTYLTGTGWNCLDNLPQKWIITILDRFIRQHKGIPQP